MSRLEFITKIRRELERNIDAPLLSRTNHWDEFDKEQIRQTQTVREDFTGKETNKIIF